MKRVNHADVTVLGQFAGHGVDVNGLIIPGRAIERTLARHAFNLIANNNGDENFKVSLIGSATAVCRGGREILLTTQHQLHGIEPSQAAMLTDSGSHIITSGDTGAILRTLRQTLTISSPSISPSLAKTDPSLKSTSSTYRRSRATLK